METNLCHEKITKFEKITFKLHKRKYKQAALFFVLSSRDICQNYKNYKKTKTDHLIYFQILGLHKNSCTGKLKKIKNFDFTTTENLVYKKYIGNVLAKPFFASS